MKRALSAIPEAIKPLRLLLIVTNKIFTSQSFLVTNKYVGVHSEFLHNEASSP